MRHHSVWSPLPYGDVPCRLRARGDAVSCHIPQRFERRQIDVGFQRRVDEQVQAAAAVQGQQVREHGRGCCGAC